MAKREKFSVMLKDLQLFLRCKNENCQERYTVISQGVPPYCSCTKDDERRQVQFALQRLEANRKISILWNAMATIAALGLEEEFPFEVCLERKK